MTSTWVDEHSWHFVRGTLVSLLQRKEWCVEYVEIPAGYKAISFEIFLFKIAGMLSCLSNKGLHCLVLRNSFRLVIYPNGKRHYFSCMPPVLFYTLVSCCIKKLVGEEWVSQDSSAKEESDLVFFYGVQLGCIICVEIMRIIEEPAYFLFLFNIMIKWQRKDQLIMFHCQRSFCLEKLELVIFLW